MMMRFVLASMVAVMMAGGVCGQTAGQLLIQRKKVSVSESGFDKLFVTPENGKALGWSGGTLGMLDVVVSGGALGTPASGNFSTGTFTWPTFNQSTTGNAANVSGVVGVLNGGTGLTSAGTAGHVLTSTGTGFVMAALSGGGSGTVTSVAGTGTVNGLTLTGTVTSSGNLTLGGTLSGVTLPDKFTVNQGVTNANAIEVTGYSLTGSAAVSLMALSGTWNTSGTPTALNLNITDTASNAASNLAAFQVGGVTRVGFPKRGAVTFPDSSVASINAPGVANWSGSLGLFGSSGGLIATLGTNNFNMASAVTLTFGGASGPTLQFEANNILGLRNASNTQALLLERTFTSATNRESLAMGWRASPALFLIQPVAGSGGGTAQDVGLGRGGSITTGAVITDGTAQVYTTGRGGIAGREAIRTVATNTTATVTDRTMLVDASAGSVTITLPAVSGLAGFRLNVKVLTTNAGANTVTVDPNASETVDGSSASLTSTTAYTSWQLHCDGAAWYLIK